MTIITCEMNIHHMGEFGAESHFTGGLGNVREELAKADTAHCTEGWCSWMTPSWVQGSLNWGTA